MNLGSSSHTPNINEQGTTPIGPKFDPSAEVTLASTFVFILFLM